MRISGQPTIKTTTKNRALLGTNPSRVGASFVNKSERTMYINFEDAATTKNWAVELLPGDLYELPQPVFTGDIFGTWDGEDEKGFCRVTEFVK